jgi:Ca2+-binding RTX toxin-like protein
MATINGTPNGDLIWGTFEADEIRGGDGNDQIGGGGGNDVIYGEGGNDNVFGETGDDTVDGGAGDDAVNDTSGGDDLLIGGPGNDNVGYAPFSLDRTLYRPTLDGGEGDDRLSLSGNLVVRATAGAGNDTLSSFATATGTVDMGSGDDVVVMAVSANSTAGPPLAVTLGSGVDTIRLVSFGSNITGSVQFTDFNPAEDKLEAIAFTSLLTRWNGQNPFTTGHFALAQAGSDVMLRFDANGGGDGYIELFRFSGLQVSQFAGRTIFGYDPGGATPPGRTIVGTAGNDYFQDSVLGLNGDLGPDSVSGLGGNDLIISGPGNDTLDGGAGNDVLYGGLGDDLARGGDGDDAIGGAGFDRIFGDAGNDTLDASLTEGVPGSPTLEGGAGDDTLYVYLLGDGSTAVARGGDGGDRLTGDGAGAMTLDGGAGNDSVVARAADGAVIILGDGVDTIGFDPREPAPSRVTVLDFQAGSGGDRLDLTAYFEAVLVGWDRDANPFATGDARLVASGADTILQIRDAAGLRDLITLRNVTPAALRPENLGGYAGDGGASPGVSFTGGFGPDTFSGGPGADVIGGQGGPDSLSGAAGADLLQGGDSSDTITGGTGADTIDGQAGGDDLTGADGVDLVRGGDGDDVIRETFATNDRVFGEGGADRIITSFAGNTSGEFLVDGGDGDDRIFYSTNGFGTNPGIGTVRLVGGAGNDVITLSGGPFLSGVNQVIVDAGEGSDRIEVSGRSSYQVTLGAGADVLQTPSSATPDLVVTDFNVAQDRIQSFVGPLRVAQRGFETIVQLGVNAPDGWVTVARLQGVTATSLTAANYIDVRADAWIVGEATPDVLSVGPEGRVDGGGGDDLVQGAAGADTLRGASGADTLMGDAGSDSLNGDVGDDRVFAGDGADTIVESSGANYLRGDAGNDTIQGGTEFDDINGNTGDDTLSGYFGDDWVVGGKDNDRLFGGAGNDLVYGNLGSDTCDGGEGNDIVRGGQDNDTLSGGMGDDFLSGDRGDDVMSGGSGADIFSSFGEAGIDRVTDFNRAQGDRVQLDPGTIYTAAQVGADTVVTMEGGGQLILVGVAMSGLTSGWITVG